MIQKKRIVARNTCDGGRLRALGRKNSRFYAPSPEGF